MEESKANRDLENWLILIHASGLSPIKLKELLVQFKQPGCIIRAEISQLTGCGLKQETIHAIYHPDQKAIEADIEWLNSPGNYFISILDAGYPALLKQIPDSPPGLFIRGNQNVLGTTQVAIVGSRNPTPGGRRVAREFAQNLGLRGITITSGLATGIDSSAHLGALDVDSITIAVLGNGLDTVYPSANSMLADRICDRGALVSEFPVGTKPIPANFPRRNRIISGLSTGTVIVEAAMNSGSLITARLAMEQGREVFAVPGSIRNPVARGCHALIREGAKLTERIEDILEETGQLNTVVKQAAPSSHGSEGFYQMLDEGGKVLLDYIGYEPVTIDQLIEESGMSANMAAAVLLSLELNDVIESLPGGSFVRKY